MLKYFIIPLAENAVSFCHYENTGRGSRFIDSDLLSKAVIWAMKENLNVQFLYPDSIVPDNLEKIIESVDHIKIVPASAQSEDLLRNADVIVVNGFKERDYDISKTYVLRVTLKEFISGKDSLNSLLKKVDRLNVVFTDIQTQSRENINAYGAFLDKLVYDVASEYEKGHEVQLNVLTDRIMLTGMNNCNAGNDSVAMDLDGRFYPCPAFIDGEAIDCGAIDTGLKIANQQLFNIKNAPVCRQCDAWHCKRCVWLNGKLTREYNTPGWQQCVMAHYERNASRKLLESLRKQQPDFMPETEISKIDYLDPFTKIEY